MNACIHFCITAMKIPVTKYISYLLSHCNIQYTILESKWMRWEVKQYSFQQRFTKGKWQCLQERKKRRKKGCRNWRVLLLYVRLRMSMLNYTTLPAMLQEMYSLFDLTMTIHECQLYEARHWNESWWGNDLLKD